MDDTRVTSNDIYQYLCKLFGSPETVRLRRIIFTAAEALDNDNDGFHEIPGGSRCEGLEIEGSDFDVVYLNKSVTIYENLSDANDFCVNDTVSVIMDNSETSLGYTKLILPNVNTSNIPERVASTYQELLSKSYKFKGKHYISSLLVRDSGYQDGDIPHGPCQIIFKNENFEFERLICFRCRKWIPLASPWKTRIRSSWPSQQLVNDITRYGVLLVPVGSKISQYGYLEWRISFSIAEKQLIRSFSHTQLLCYAMLKVVVSDIIKKQHGELLCSYFVKTIMLWMIQENNSNYWFPANLVKCFMACLQRLIYCVKYRDCRHYFIPEINFFEDRFNDTDHRNLLSSLFQVYNSGWKALLDTKTFQNFNSQSSKYPDFVSSVVPTCGLIPSLTNNTDLSNLVRNIIIKSDFTSKSTKRVLLYAAANICEEIIMTNNVNFNGNKVLYKQYKSVLPELVLSTRAHCVTGWCYLASLFYKLKLYSKCNDIVDHCLKKCTKANIYLAIRTHMNIPVHIQNMLCSSRWFPAVLRHCFIGCVPFRSQSLLPEELTFLNVKDNSVVIPPFVFLFFLKFICAYHLKQVSYMQDAFEGLQTTAMHEFFIVNDNQLRTTKEIVKVAKRLLLEA